MAEHIFLYLFKFMDYSEVGFSPSSNQEKKTPNIFLQGAFFKCRSKTLIFAKIDFFSPFWHAHLKCYTCGKGEICNIFFRGIQKSK